MFLFPRSSSSSSRAVSGRCLRLVVHTPARCGAVRRIATQRTLATAATFQPHSTTLTPPCNTDCDVLIIGAGPAGLTAGLALTRAGIKVRIVDKRSPEVIAGHGDGLQPRTLEILQSYGLSRRILDEANQMHAAAFYNPGPNGIERIRRESDVTCPRTLYPFKATLGQGRIEQILADALSEHGVRIERPAIPLSFTSSSDGVQVEIQRFAPLPGQAEQESIRTSYVIGADGAHSWVRKQLGFTMDGEHTDWIWGVLDTYPKTNFPDIRNRVAIHSKHGSCMIIPREGDKVRLYIQLGELQSSGAGSNSSSRKDKPILEGPEYIMDVARKCLQPYTIEFPEKIDWWTHYIIGQRVASGFYRGRVFIIGDACHTHSPKAGQGMNAGMGDAHNLAWKLSHVIKGYAKPGLLSTYEAERRKYAQELIDFDRKFAALFSGKARTAEHLDGVTHEEFLRTFQMYGGFTSGISIGYSPSLIVKQFEMSNISAPVPNIPHSSSHHGQATAAQNFQHHLHSPPHTQATTPAANLPRRAVHAQVPLMPPAPANNSGVQVQARAVSSSATRTLAVPFEEARLRQFDSAPNAVTLGSSRRLPSSGLPPHPLHTSMPNLLRHPLNTTMQHPMLGYRVPPQIVVRAADFKPVQLHDLMVSDGKFKVLVFIGSALVQPGGRFATTHGRQNQSQHDESLDALSHRFEQILEAYGAPVNVYSVVALKAKELDRHVQIIGASGNESRGFFRGGWRNVFSDDRTIDRSAGGDAFHEFGISSRSSGALFVVRPDGYFGLVSDLGAEGLNALKLYLSEL